MVAINEPNVTVYMPVLNGAKYIRKAIDSILGQSYRDFEFIIIDDGSNDDTASVIQKYRDPRIKLICNKRNIGTAAASNKAMALARGRFVVRMDCDDISLKDRLVTQVAFMEKNPEVAVCGAWIKTFGGTRTIMKYPTKHEEIRAQLLFDSSIANPSTIIRKNIFLDNGLNFKETYKRAEDYDLWVRASDVVRLVNLPRILVKYRIRENYRATESGKKEKVYASEVRRRQVNRLCGRECELEDLELHEQIAAQSIERTVTGYKMAESWLLNLEQCNRDTHVYEDETLKSAIGQVWYSLCASAASSGSWVFNMYKNSTIAQWNNSQKRKNSAKIAMKTIATSMRPFRFG